jgi:hypothetical protein
VPLFDARTFQAIADAWPATRGERMRLEARLSAASTARKFDAPRAAPGLVFPWHTPDGRLKIIDVVDLIRDQARGMFTPDEERLWWGRERDTQLLVLDDSRHWLLLDIRGSGASGSLRTPDEKQSEGIGRQLSNSEAAAWLAANGYPWPRALRGVSLELDTAPCDPAGAIDPKSQSPPTLDVDEDGTSHAEVSTVSSDPLTRTLDLLGERCSVTPRLIRFLWGRLGQRVRLRQITTFVYGAKNPTKLKLATARTLIRRTRDKLTHVGAPLRMMWDRGKSEAALITAAAT